MRAEPDLTEGRVYWIPFHYKSDSERLETRGKHPGAVVSKTSTEHSTAAIAPIYSAVNSEKKFRRLYFHGVPIDAGVAGADRDALLLVAQIDAISRSQLKELLDSGQANPREPPLTSELLDRARRYLADLLIGTRLVRWPFHIRWTKEARPRPLLTIAPGDVILVREYGPGGCNPETPDKNVSKVSPWVVVSSDLWLQLLQAAAIHRQGLAGLLQGVVAVIPVSEHPASDHDLVVPLPASETWLPAGGHSAFHLLRTRNVCRIERRVGQVDDVSFGRIAAGLRAFLNLPRSGS